MKPRVFVSLAVVTALVGLACTDDPPTAPENAPSKPAWTPPGDASFAYTPGSDTENCIEDVVEFYDGSNSVPLNCTAEDVRIASVELPDTPIPLECTLGEPVIIPTLIAELVAGASERYDIGGWIARDGGDARGGACTRFFLDGNDFGTGGISPLAPNCGTDNHDPNGGPWFNAECAEDSGDLCGDLVQNESNFVTLTNVEVLCQDPDDDGLLEVTSCLSWDNGKSAGTNNKPSCADLDDARPNNKSKCNCEELNIPIIVRESALLEVVKDLDPPEDTGLFNLQIDGVTEQADAGDGDTSGPVTVSAGTSQDPGDTHTVGEIAGTGTSLGDYDSSIECVDRGTTNVVASATGTGPLDVDVEPDDDVVCTISNALKGKIIVEKTVNGNGETFAFTGDITPPACEIGDGGTCEKVVSAGQYTVTETVTDGYSLTDITCDDANSSGDTGTATATYNVEAGEIVKCTFTNTRQGVIKVKKLTVPAGESQQFTFTGDVAGSIGHDGTLSTENLDPGTYSSTETVPEGWDLTEISCSDGNSTGNTTTGEATFNLEAGESITCTFTNTKRGSITIEKQTLPDGDAQSFTFAGDVAGSLTDGQTATQSLAPGAYTSQETVPDGWALTDITCDDANSSGDTGTATATFNLEAGEDVKCTFTNTKLGSITVEKQTDPPGDPQSFTFTGDAAGSIADDGTIVVTGLLPNTYTSTETVPAGWDLKSIQCDDANSSGDTGTATATFNLEPGETVTCTFTNEALARISLQKLVDGLPSTLSWNFTLNGPGVSEGVTFTSSTTFNDAFLTLGSTYTICEAGLPASWTANWTLDGAPVTPTPDPIDNSILCYDFTPTSPDDAGATLQFVVDNRTPPGGEPRTIGYWKNWNRCSGGGQAANADRNGGAAEGFWLLEDVLPLFLGSYEVTSCANGVSILDKRSLDGRKRANDGAYALAAQLLAAKANISPVVNAGCRPADLNTWIADADALLTSLGFSGTGSYLLPRDSGRDQALYLAGNLDDYNNGMYCAP